MYDSFAWCKVFSKPYLVSFCVFVFFFFWKKQKKKKNKKGGEIIMCIVGNPIILHCQIISFPPKKEKENGIMEFLNLFIYIYSKNPLWLRIISRVKRRFSKVVKLYLLWSKKKSLWNSDRTSDEVNQKPFTKTILLTSKTDIYIWKTQWTIDRKSVV